MKKINILSIIGIVVLLIVVPVSNRLLANTVSVIKITHIKNGHPSFLAYSEDDIISSMYLRGWKVFSNRYVYLEEGQSCSWDYHFLEGGYGYTVVAFSEDEDVKDVDLDIEYSNGTPIKSDHSSSDMATVKFYFNYSHTVKIKVTNSSSDSPSASRIKFIIFRNSVY